MTHNDDAKGHPKTERPKPTNGIAGPELFRQAQKRLDRLGAGQRGVHFMRERP